jgi:hypothetical protein
VENPILRNQDKDEKGKPIIPGQDEEDKNSYLYAFGNMTRPRPPRAGNDIDVDGEGFVNAQPEPGQTWPQGASTFGDVTLINLKGPYHRIRRKDPMPTGLGVMADGTEVGGDMGPTHHTIFPTQRMLFLTFQNLFLGLPWTYAGKK